MAGARAAIRYAKAVLDLAKSQNAAEAINTDMLTISQAISESQELNDFLQNPVVRSSVKQAALAEVFKGTQDLTGKLVEILMENKRIALLGDVAKSYTQLFAEYQGSQTAKVTTAVPLTSDLESKVLEKVKELTGKDAQIENIVDESILGGFILRVGDIQYNASIANKLNRLKREFTLN
ncbi:ATP synthase F1 subunit delta [Mangrovimonas cancribranchiae]|uniref:ATP synthase subunit delta n=1 Tax=Mangrovimonas cancribranchiae TaxID=3080055 RepID=A0AAU6P6R8_9FLAO